MPTLGVCVISTTIYQSFSLARKSLEGVTSHNLKLANDQKTIVLKFLQPRERKCPLFGNGAYTKLSCMAKFFQKLYTSGKLTHCIFALGVVYIQQRPHGFLKMEHVVTGPNYV